MIYCECRDTNSSTFIVGANFKTLKKAKAYVEDWQKIIPSIYAKFYRVYEIKVEN